MSQHATPKAAAWPRSEESGLTFEPSQHLLDECSHLSNLGLERRQLSVHRVGCWRSSAVDQPGQAERVPLSVVEFHADDQAFEDVRVDPALAVLDVSPAKPPRLVAS